jgi:hypothetical protein
MISQFYFFYKYNHLFALLLVTDGSAKQVHAIEKQ